MAASYEGHIEVVETLIKEGADVNKATEVVICTLLKGWI